MEYLATGQFFGETDRAFFLDGLTLTDTGYTVARVDWHYHENPYFTFITAGGILEGGKRGVHRCPAGTLLFHNWQEPHYNLDPEAGTRGFQLETTAGWFARFDLDLPAFPAYAKIADPALKLLFHRIYGETRPFGNESPLAIEGLLLEALDELVGLKKNAETKKPRWVGRLDERLRADLTERFVLRELARELDLHPVYLCRTFPKFFGCGFGEYVRKLKVERSLVLLRNRELSLTEVAFASGFADQSHFIRCFKSLMKTGPKNYRDAILK
ncbi:MAG: helix-turn-helix transcriptional regulator [Acidobacteria bacterium]|nr:helix-turn-helix transcriptional regulator [Acidobacteriota bacterium]